MGWEEMGSRQRAFASGWRKEKAHKKETELWWHGFAFSGKVSICEGWSSWRSGTVEREKATVTCPLLWAGLTGLHRGSLCAGLEKGRLHSARSGGDTEGPAPAGTVSTASLGAVTCKGTGSNGPEGRGHCPTGSVPPSTSALHWLWKRHSWEVTRSSRVQVVQGKEEQSGGVGYCCLSAFSSNKLVGTADVLGHL